MNNNSAENREKPEEPGSNMPSTLVEPDAEIQESSLTDETTSGAEEIPSQLSDDDHVAPLADPSKLEDRIPAQFRTTKAFAFWTIGFSILYVLMSYQPLWHTDIWGHVAYGHVILETGTIPATEPFMPLAEGVRLIDTSWLSQIILAALEGSFSTAGLQFFYAFSVTACCLLIAGITVRLTGNQWFAITSLCLFTIMVWKAAFVIRPQLAGMVCFLMLIAATPPWKHSTLSLPSRFQWFLVPGIMCLWANLHGSFPVGLLYLGGLFAGRSVDKIVRTGNWAAVINDESLVRSFLVLQLSAVAVLLNPYGLALYVQVLTFGQNPNLADLTEWNTMTIEMYHGKVAAAMAVLLAVVYRWSPRRVSSSELLLLVGFGLLAVVTRRMLIWLAPVAALAFSVHGHAIWKRFLARRLTSNDIPESDPEERRGIWTACATGSVWCAFAYAPIGLMLLHGAGTPEQQAKRYVRSLGKGTPVAATEYLNTMKPRGLVFNSYEWGDYLLHAGPTDIQLFTTSHAHLVPPDVWNDYLRIARVGSNWNDRLDRYGIDTVIVDKPRRKSLIGKLKDSDDWKVAYEDRQAAILVRKDPIGVQKTEKAMNQ